MKKAFSIILGIILVAAIISSLISNSYGQENILTPPKHQWKTIPGIDEIICRGINIITKK